MDAVRVALRQKVLEDPQNSLLASSLAILDEMAHTSQSGDETARKVAELLAQLEEQGLWGTTDTERALAKDLVEARLINKPSNFTIVAAPLPPSRSPASLPWRTNGVHAHLIDAELMAQLNEVAFLHVLATAPDKVVPPGKSLRAALSSPEAAHALNQSGPPDGQAASGAPPTLQATVEEIVQKAFWDEAMESLADPAPARQLTRLKRLYADLHTALLSLLPPTHPSMVTLAAPLSPTSAPLVSAVRHLKQLAAALKTRCAPVRDPDLNAVIAILSPITPSGSSSDSDNDSSTPMTLPACIVAAVKELLRLADVMKADLASVAFSVVSDEELADEVSRAAQEKERKVVLALYGAQGGRERWHTWLADADSEPDDMERQDAHWVRRLVQALGSDVAVSCPLPNPSQSSSSSTTGPGSGTDALANTNVLPPQFLFSTNDLLRLQNHLQALVIAAVLRTLVPLRSHSNAANASIEISPSNSLSDQNFTNAEERTFTERVLSLLMIEIDETSQDSGTTKLIHLADEVVREHRRLSNSQASDNPNTTTPASPHQPDEQMLRNSVDALLSSTNGVFILLRRRLLGALASSLASALQSQERARAAHVPDTMQTGRDRKRLRPDPSLCIRLPSSQAQAQRHGDLRHAITASEQVKGYDDPVLRRGVGVALGELADVVEWMRGTWVGTLDFGSSQ
ncbi:hypothetical protein DFH11DRAFT_1612459 [Phellopilus nigrolimitatus]|nr:hypothetical protein DFH11DRAFT_1612459 [Phellopilus nigrolimitatus]